MIQGHQALPAGWEVLAEKGADLVPVVLDLRWVARIHGLTLPPRHLPASVGQSTGDLGSSSHRDRHQHDLDDRLPPPTQAHSQHEGGTAGRERQTPPGPESLMEAQHGQGQTDQREQQRPIPEGHHTEQAHQATDEVEHGVQEA